MKAQAEIAFPPRGEFKSLMGRMARVPSAPGATDSPRSVLRYPGGKTRAVEKDSLFHSRGHNRIVRAFSGGRQRGACLRRGPEWRFTAPMRSALWLISGNMRCGNRCFCPSAWEFIIRFSRAKFYSLQKGYHGLPSDLEKAAVFYRSEQIFVFRHDAFPGECRPDISVSRSRP